MSLFGQIKVGLALGGGGPRGLTHIGVIKVLERNNIPIDCITGSSIGAMIGGLYAATKNINLIEQIATNNSWKNISSLFFDPSLKNGLLQGKKIENFMKDIIGNTEFKDLKIPFAAVTTDLGTGQMQVISQGRVTDAIRASISIPMLFKPIQRDGRLLADGGLSSPLPVKAVKDMGADFAVGVNLYHYFPKEKIDFFRLPQDSLTIILNNLAKFEEKQADVVICPKTESLSWGRFILGKDFESGILLGEQAAEEQIDKIKLLLTKKKAGNFLKKIFHLKN